MSIVGPRPHATAHNEMFEGRILPFSRRHNIKPGITGWAQVNGHRGETDTLEKMQRRVEHDLYYIDNWSFLLDMKIILLTLFSKERTSTPISEQPLLHFHSLILRMSQMPAETDGALRASDIKSSALRFGK